jgi:hypothetical protein
VIRDALGESRSSGDADIPREAQHDLLEEVARGLRGDIRRKEHVRDLAEQLSAPFRRRFAGERDEICRRVHE